LLIEIVPLGTPAKFLDAVSPKLVVAVDALPSSTEICDMAMVPEDGNGII
jgi:hypothetical protein